MFHRRFWHGFQDVTDGLSNTIMVGEFITGDANGNAYQLGDMVRAQSTSVFNATFPTRAQMEAYGVACQGGTANHTSNPGNNYTNPMMYGAAINTLVPPNWPYPTCHECPGCGEGDAPGVYPARSKHTGGAHHLLGDGAVRFISDNIDFVTYQGLGSTRGGEVIGEF